MLHERKCEEILNCSFDYNLFTLHKSQMQCCIKKVGNIINFDIRSQKKKKKKKKQSKN